MHAQTVDSIDTLTNSLTAVMHLQKFKNVNKLTNSIRTLTNSLNTLN
jgi:hypothetical protein